jgi:hypothetical protein
MPGEYVMRGRLWRGPIAALSLVHGAQILAFLPRKGTRAAHELRRYSVSRDQPIAAHAA